jgi:hypothetical protein
MPPPARDNPSGGVAVTLFSFVNNVASYCCGLPVVSGSSVACPNGAAPFTIDDASVIYGRAFLTNTFTVGGVPPPPSPSNGTAGGAGGPASGISIAIIGAAIAIPLSVLSVSLLVWAMWERKKRKRTVAELQDKVASAGSRSSVVGGPAGRGGGGGPRHSRDYGGESFYGKHEREPVSAVTRHTTGSTIPSYHAGGRTERDRQQSMASVHSVNAGRPAELGSSRYGVQELE